MSSRARVVSGVCTSTCLPFARSQRLGLQRPRSVRETRAARFSAVAVRLRRSMVWSSRVSCTGAASGGPSVARCSTVQLLR